MRHAQSKAAEWVASLTICEERTPSARDGRLLHKIPWSKLGGADKGSSSKAGDDDYWAPTAAWVR